MKRFVRVWHAVSTVAFAIVCNAGSACAQNSTIDVGLQPLSIVPVGQRVHVFHNQVDKNFNGQQEEGDAPASWWILDGDGAALGTKEFEWGLIGYPFRPYVDEAAQVVYISHLGRVRSFSLETQELLDDTVALYDAAGVAAHGDNIYVSVRPSFTDPGQFIAYNVATGQETVRTVGVNPQQIIPFRTSDDAEGVLVLSEGGGTGNPSLLDKHYFDGTAAPAPLELGVLGNHVVVQGDSAYVVMNGSYEVQVIDIKSWAIVKSIAVPASAFNGPREVVVNGDKLFVSTFDGDVRLYSVASGEQVDIHRPGGKPEGIALVGGKLWISNAFQEGSFEAGNTIAVWDFTTTSIAEDLIGFRPVVAPSVVSDEAVIAVPFFSAVRIDIVSASGARIGEITEGTAEGGVYRARFVPARYSLAAGRYFLRIQTGAMVRTVPVAVVR